MFGWTDLDATRNDGHGSEVAPNDDKVTTELMNDYNRAISMYDRPMINFEPSNQLVQQMS